MNSEMENDSSHNYGGSPCFDEALVANSMKENTFSVYLRNVRKELGYTQKEFADLIGITQANLSNLENPKKIQKKPIRRVVVALAPYFKQSSYNIDIDQLALLAGYDYKNLHVDSQAELASVRQKKVQIENLSPQKVDFLLGLAVFLDDSQNRVFLEKTGKLLKTISEGQSNASYDQAINFREFILNGLKVMGY